MRNSSIDRLPSEVRTLIGDLRRGGRTIDEIMAKLRELDVDVSRSALGRHTKEIDEMAERLHESRVVAEAVMDRIEGQSGGQVARLNIELMHNAVLKLISGETRLDAQEAMFLGTTLQKLSSAAKVDLDRELKIRQEAQKVATEKAAKAATGAAKKAGLSAEAIAAIERDVLGIVKQ